MLIINLLKESKKLYLENQGKCGMCWCIKVIANKDKDVYEQINKGHVPYTEIVKQIPEFNPEFLGAVIDHKWIKLINVGLEFWWKVGYSEPRIKAFDKLIELYENSNKEFIW